VLISLLNIYEKEKESKEKIQRPQDATYQRRNKNFVI